MELDKLLKQYQDMFNDVFPVAFLELSDTETINLLKKCISTHQPFKWDVPKTALV